MHILLRLNSRFCRLSVFAGNSYYYHQLAQWCTWSTFVPSVCMLSALAVRVPPRRCAADPKGRGLPRRALPPTLQSAGSPGYAGSPEVTLGGLRTRAHHTSTRNAVRHLCRADSGSTTIPRLAKEISRRVPLGLVHTYRLVQNGSLEPRSLAVSSIFCSYFFGPNTLTYMA